MYFAKGHGTGNDFVVLPDPDGGIELTPQLVSTLCARHFGIGADGVLRVVRSAKHPDAARYAGDAEWFMDYHNADGSVAEMCGNGVRVFARYLTSYGLVHATRFPIATRAGLVTVDVAANEVSAEMTRPVVGGASAARLGEREYPGTTADVGNPHLVCPVDDVSTVDLSEPPILDATVFPESANVEFIAGAEPVAGADLHVRMRVYERGSAETLSCGTGACAVAAVALGTAGLDTGTVAVDLPGGRLTIAIDRDRCVLTGPALIVATGDVLV
ncbi:diaminopimelate epimerase [Rugosimonospora acidiphila]|uniref:Diaminopimelate epimerase n=1 Tax=Rugosimonospora acidiphila TaxID=556531 RepID=A0ABP9RP10_9ACTN